VDVGVAVAGAGFGVGAVNGRGGDPVGQGAVGPVVVAGTDECVEAGLELGEGGGLGTEPFWGSARTARLCPEVWGGSADLSSAVPRRSSSASKPLRSPLLLDMRAVNTMPLRGQAGLRLKTSYQRPSRGAAERPSTYHSRGWGTVPLLWHALNPAW
jgi:hypothetical protein